MENNNERKKVPFAVFIWAVGILFTLFVLGLSVSMNAKTDIAEVRGDVKSISTDLQWIRETLNEIKQEIKK